MRSITIKNIWKEVEKEKGMVKETVTNPSPKLVGKKGPIPGTILVKAETPLDEVKKMLSEGRETYKAIKKLPRLGKKLMEISVDRIKTLKNQVDQLQMAYHCQSEGMRVLKIDKSVKRRIKFRNSEFELQLVWSTRIPTKRFMTKTVRRRYSSYNIKARVPIPTEKVRKAIEQYEHKFDHMQVWWVPNDLNIVEKKPPIKDPVLVGVINITGLDERYYELVRWIDEKVEDPYWAKEGY